MDTREQIEEREYRVKLMVLIGLVQPSESVQTALDCYDRWSAQQAELGRKAALWDEAEPLLRELKPWTDDLWQMLFGMYAGIDSPMNRVQPFNRRIRDLLARAEEEAMQ